MKPVGLLGGTFDPVHFGHLRPAIELYERLGLAEMRLVPCRVSPHRDAPFASPEQRLRMLELAVADHPALRVDAQELQRPAPSYTVDTLEAMRASRPAQTPVFVMGRDAFDAFTRWHRWRRILELAHLVVTARPGALRNGPLPVSGDLAELTRPSGAIVACEVTQLDISATRIRALAAAGADLSYLLPEPVRRYLLEHGLYCTPPEHDAKH